jgi:signal transduction histidine kinase
MASLGQLTAGVAHEINNPLAFVSSNINRLQEYFQDSTTLLKKWFELETSISAIPEFQKCVTDIKGLAEEIDYEFILEDFNRLMQSIHDGVERIKKIVEGLRGFAHSSEGEYQESDINKAIDETLTIVWNEIKYIATVGKDYGELPKIHCNIGEIKQVLVNLIVNAAHSIDENGKITIKTVHNSDSISIIITDNGCGISESNLKRIFDPFFTTKPVGKGSGLGLWVSASIVEKHNGRLLVQSNIGEGSIFTIQLPLSGNE